MIDDVPQPRIRSKLLCGIVLTLLSIAIASSLGIAQGSAGPRGSTGRGHYGAPEIDPSLSSAGIVLLVGGTFVLVEARRRARG
jgi:hypothetical protein